jgi:hypothetical protein
LVLATEDLMVTMKTYTVEIHDDGSSSCSDGYHTFDELYAHRCLLFINLCLLMPKQAYWREHYEGWPLLGLLTPAGQVTYHVPEKFLELFRGKIREGGPEWDGHTPPLVESRLIEMAEFVSSRLETLSGPEPQPGSPEP